MTTTIEPAILRQRGELALAELAECGVGLLIAEGIHGNTGQPNRCPVAEFLNRRTGYKAWSVYLANAVLVHPAIPNSGFKALELPLEVQALVNAIDRGHYPEVVTRTRDRLFGMQS